MTTNKSGRGRRCNVKLTRTTAGPSLPVSHSEVSVGGKETLTADSTDEHSSNRDETEAADVDRACVFQSLWLKCN